MMIWFLARRDRIGPHYLRAGRVAHLTPVSEAWRTRWRYCRTC